MTDPITQAEIDEAQALLAKATAGPWRVRTNKHPNTDGTPWGWVSHNTDANVCVPLEQIVEAIHPGCLGRARDVALEAARRVHALQPSAWLPIPLTVDTSKAPFDGERYLLGRALKENALGCWRGAWVESYYHGRPLKYVPTHYMPLPRGPQ